ncbi:hypothetical protein [Conexibacter sp. SYSU D00693]|uniref:hypothetical protein n=1 Tax=Conexibacter sp. SYSU D00693 TaxID=2812560 RepID=UPI00196B67A8|nr:hypothetical protein [Conexibacter sp. SYSU D00693]
MTRCPTCDAGLLELGEEDGVYVATCSNGHRWRVLRAGCNAHGSPVYELEPLDGAPAG